MGSDMLRSAVELWEREWITIMVEQSESFSWTKRLRPSPYWPMYFEGWVI